MMKRGSCRERRCEPRMLRKDSPPSKLVLPAVPQRLGLWPVSPVVVRGAAASARSLGSAAVSSQRLKESVRVFGAPAAL